MRFCPPHCPYPACRAHTQRPFLWRRKGFHRRLCDGRPVQRFLCRTCQRTFSTQSFRLDYRLKRPGLHLALFKDFISKVTHRQSARTLGCDRKTVAHRLDLLGAHCEAFHRRVLERCGQKLWGGTYQLDELETFEHNRRLQPLTLAVLIERRSYFVLEAQLAPLPCRGGLSRSDRAKKLERERRWGRRRSGSRGAVERCWATLERVHRPQFTVAVQSDCKSSYARSLARRFGPRLRHAGYSSKAPRNYHNPLFPINHTFALLRDSVSRLVRRTWAAAKLAPKLRAHVWIWIAYRNYIRGITNDAPQVTPAMALGLSEKQWPREQLLAWKVAAAD